MVFIKLIKFMVFIKLIKFMFFFVESVMIELNWLTGVF